MVALARSSSLTLNCFKNSETEENMRIIDFLSDREDDYDENEDIKKKRRVFDLEFSKNFISKLCLRNSFKIIKKKEKKAVSSSNSDQKINSENTEARRNSDISINSERKHENFSFNLGMGVGLAFLLTKSAAEMNKMVELRTQMETLLKEIRQEVQRSDVTASSSESNNNISYSPSHCFEDTTVSKSNSVPKYSVESYRELNYATKVANTRDISMNQLEAELEAELERLQCNLEGESSSSVQRRTEVGSENAASSFEGFSINYEEENNLKKGNQEYNGVCAHELERKLHELLEMRQQEQISELESALECAEKKLREKDLELHLWKETQWAASLNKNE